MNLQSVTASASLVADIIPGDPTASGTYQLGRRASRVDLASTDQVFAATVSAIDGSGAAVISINLPNGTVTNTGGTPVISGGDGNDPDGQTVDLDTLYGILITNTGSENLFLEVNTWTGAPFDSITIAAGGFFHWISPPGFSMTTAILDLTAPNAEGACEIVVVGKMTP